MMWSPGFPVKLLAQHGQIVAVILLALCAAAFEPAFLTRFNLTGVGFQYSVIGLIALGQFVVIVTGGIDLSQGSVVGLAAVISAIAQTAWGYPAGIAAAPLVGLLFGVANGLLVSFTSIPPFVVTLGTLGIGRGLALTMTSGQSVALSDRSLAWLANARLFDTPISFLFFVACAVTLAVFVNGWPKGRELYAVGGHEENARLTGLNVRGVKILAYSFSGLMSGLGGLFLLSRMGTGHPLSGTGYELISISAVIIGGASLFGGVGRVSGLVAGVLLLGVLDSMINLSGASPYLQGTVKGTIVLLALAFTQFSVSRLAGE
jgi:ribose/xylose/arabinose/galactoside ABC-type transport system permease subunit